jgi:hypothetical protein
VLNDIKFHAFLAGKNYTYKYGYSYGYGYRKGQGYYEEDTMEKRKWWKRMWR